MKRQRYSALGQGALTLLLAPAALPLSESRFYYEYFMPDNVPGINHDGHVDTWLEIVLA